MALALPVRKGIRCELAVDLVLMVAMNLLAQLVFYGAAATSGRVSAFAVLMIGLAQARRWCTRTGFRVWAARRWRSQPRWHSALEVSADTVIGWMIAVGLQVVIYQGDTSIAYANGVTMGCYGLTWTRRYVLRRVFERRG